MLPTSARAVFCEPILTWLTLPSGKARSTGEEFAVAQVLELPGLALSGSRACEVVRALRSSRSLELIDLSAASASTEAFALLVEAQQALPGHLLLAPHV